MTLEQQAYAHLALNKILSSEEKNLNTFRDYISQAWEILDALNEVPESRKELLPELVHLSLKDLTCLYLTYSLIWSCTLIKSEGS